MNGFVRKKLEGILWMLRLQSRLKSLTTIVFVHYVIESPLWRHSRLEKNSKQNDWTCYQSALSSLALFSFRGIEDGWISS